jgi:predicted nucleic acid-binding protein
MAGGYRKFVLDTNCFIDASRTDAGADRRVLSSYVRRRRVVNPSAAAWEALGTTLARLVEHQGLVRSEVRKSLVFDILIAWSCRETGAVLVSRNVNDLSRIAEVFKFEFVAPYPL